MMKKFRDQNYDPVIMTDYIKYKCFEFGYQYDYRNFDRYQGFCDEIYRVLINDMNLPETRPEPDDFMELSRSPVQKSIIKKFAHDPKQGRSFKLLSVRYLYGIQLLKGINI